METTQTEIIRKALDLIAKRLEGIEARRMADGLLLQALIDSLSDKSAFMASAEDMLTRLPDLMASDPQARSIQGEAVQHIRAVLQALGG